MNFQMNEGKRNPFTGFPKKSYLFLVVILFLCRANVQAQTWSTSPGSGIWNTVTNWSTLSEPNSQSAAATFGASSTTSLTFNAGITVGTLQFNSGSPVYNFAVASNPLALFGTGVVNNSSSAETFTVGNSLNLFNGATSANSTINVSSGGAVTFNTSSTASTSKITISSGGTLNFGGLIGTGSSTAASAAITNNGNVYFANSSTAANSNIVNNAAMTFLDSSNAGSAAVSNNGTIAFNSDSASVYSTAGNANFNNTAAGSISFMGNSSAGSATVFNNGSMAFINNSTAGSATIFDANNLNFYNSATAGNAAININGACTVVFNNASSAGAASIVNNGSITFTADSSSSFSTAGSAVIQNYNTLTFNNFASAGSATIINNFGSTNMNFFNNSTAANAVINSTASAVIFNDSSTAGNAFISDNAAVIFTNTASAGSATVSVFNQNGSQGGIDFGGTATGGTMRVILGANSFLNITGETAATPVTVGSVEGSGAVTMGATNLFVGSNNLNTTLTGGINGTTGALTKIGTGTWTLTGAGTYAGGTTISGGDLAVGSSTALGTGLVVVNGGTLSTNGTFHSINVASNYTQTSAGTLQLGLGGTTTGQWDSLNVTGSSTLAGNLQLVFNNNYRVRGSASFDLINTGSFINRFSSITDPLSGDSVSAVYTSTELLLNVTAPTFTQLGVTANEKALGTVMDNFYSNSGDPTLISNLNTLSNSALSTVYDQMSPSSLTPMFKMGFSTAQVQAGMVSDRVSQLFGNSKASDNTAAWNGQGPMFASNMPAEEEAEVSQTVPQPERWGAFANGMTNFGTVTSDGNGAGYQFSTGGTTAGVDYRFDKDFVVGLMLGYDQTGTSQSSGTVNVSGGQAGLYAGWKIDQLRIEAQADGGLNSYTTQRMGFGGTASGNTSGLEYTGQLNIGYDIKMDDFKVSPFVSSQLTQVNVNGFTETGSLAPLTYGNQNEAYVNSDLGSQFAFNFTAFGVKWSPNVSAAWEHVYQGNNDSLTANFGTGNNFTVAGSATGTDAAVLGGGLNAEFAKGFNIYGAYQGKVGMTNYTDQSISAGVNIGF